MPLSRDDEYLIAEWAQSLDGIPLPAQMADHLRYLVSTLRDKRPASSAGDAEIKAAGALSVYGPSRLIPAGFCREKFVSDFTHFADERACECVVAHGCQLPPGARDWEHLWTRAWDALFAMVRDIIYVPVRWFGVRVGGLDEKALSSWARNETYSCAALIRGYLVRGCTCYERDADFHTRDGMHRCHTDHHLRNWNPSATSLANFVWRAALLGELRLPDPAKNKPEVAMANSARKGILSRTIMIHEALLMAGPTLKCGHVGCAADITAADVCPNGHPLTPIKDVTWWFWTMEGRSPVHCRRCLPNPGGCDGLYYQAAAACPCCQQSNWSPRPTVVWVSNGPNSHSVDDVPSKDRSIEDFLANDLLNKVLTSLSADQQEVARLTFVEGLSTNEGANQLGITREKFREIRREVEAILREQFPDASDSI